MKKNRIKKKVWLALSSTILLVGGCQEVQDEFQIDLSDQKEISVRDGMLHFPNAEIFENYMMGEKDYPVKDLSSFESLFDFAGNQTSFSLRVSEAENTALLEFIDTPLLKILDQDGLLNIGEYFIVLDFEKEIAAVTKEKSKIHLLRAKKYDDNNIRLYSFGEELLNILFDNDVNSNNMHTALKDPLGSGSPSTSSRVLECALGTPKPGLNLSYQPHTTSSNPTVRRQQSWVEDKVIDGYIYRVRAKHAYQAAAI